MCWHSNHLFTVYVPVELKDPLHCSQAAEHMCVQIFFWPIPSSTALAQSVTSCSSTNGSSEHQVPVTKATSHSRFLPEGYPPSPIIQLFFYYFVSASSLIIQDQESLLYSYGEELQVWQCQDTGEACWQICWVSLLWTLNDFSWIKIIDLVILKKIYY